MTDDNDALLWQVWMTSVQLPALTVANELGLFEIVYEKEVTAIDVSDALGIEPRPTLALLDVMTSLNFLSVKEGVYSITQTASKHLLRESPFYWGGMLDRMSKMAITHDILMMCVKENKSKVYGDDDMYEDHHQNKEQVSAHCYSMHSRAASSAEYLAEFKVFHDVQLMLDVGGGRGTYSVAILKHNPHIKSTVLDLPLVCELAMEYIDENGLSDKIITQPIDFFKEDFPLGNDTVFFADVFHDWPYEKCLMLAKKAYKALPDKGKILLHEIVLREGRGGPLVAASYSMAMLFATEGQQFTFSELSKLLKEAGFRNVQRQLSYGYYSLIIGIK